MYEFIINPQSGRRVQITGKLGRSILNNYIKQLKQLKQFVQRGGGAGWNEEDQAWVASGPDEYSGDEAIFLNMLGVIPTIGHTVDRVPGLADFFTNDDFENLGEFFDTTFRWYVENIVHAGRITGNLHWINEVLAQRRRRAVALGGGNHGHRVFIEALEVAAGVIARRRGEILQANGRRRGRFPRAGGGGGGGRGDGICSNWNGKPGSCCYGDDCRFIHRV